MKVYACSRAGTEIASAESTSSVEVIPIKLDISSPTSIKDLAATIAKSEKSGLNVLINNASIWTGDLNAPFEEKKQIIEVNYNGCRNMCLTFLPLMARNGRIVNLSSDSGELQYYPETLANRFRDPKITVDQLNELAEEYLESQKSGKGKEEWQSATAYYVSKALTTGLTRALARDGKQHGLLINAVHPGWVQTDMGNASGSPPKTMEEGSLATLRLAFKDIGGVTGGYWRDPIGAKPGEGELHDW